VRDPAAVRIGREVQNDDALLSFARRLWSSDAYQAWRLHMRRDVEESLSIESLHSPKDHLDKT
jgi:hypothetical protein